jgi:hypothetical protein
MADLVGEGSKKRMGFLVRIGCLGTVFAVGLGCSAYFFLNQPKKIDYYIPSAPVAMNGQHYCYTQFKALPPVWYVLDLRQQEEPVSSQGIFLRGVADILKVGIASISGTIGRNNLVQFLMQQQITSNTALPLIGDSGFRIPGMTKTEIREFNFYGRYTVANSDIRMDGLVYNLADGKPIGEPGNFHCSTIFPKKDWGT